jgi:hypothetical protein
MAMHIYTSTGWKAVNQNGGVLDDRGLIVYDDGLWKNAALAQIRTSGGWVGFLDNITLQNDSATGYGDDYGAADWGINPIGEVYVGGDISGPIYNYCQNIANVGQYEIQVVLSSGGFTAFSSPVNTWLSCSDSRQWSVETPNMTYAEFTASIRNAITTEVLATSIITLEAGTYN